MSKMHLTLRFTGISGFIVGQKPDAKKKKRRKGGKEEKKRKKGGQNFAHSINTFS